MQAKYHGVTAEDVPEPGRDVTRRSHTWTGSGVETHSSVQPTCYRDSENQELWLLFPELLLTQCVALAVSVNSTTSLCHLPPCVFFCFSTNLCKTRAAWLTLRVSRCSATFVVWQAGLICPCMGTWTHSKLFGQAVHIPTYLAELTRKVWDFELAQDSLLCTAWPMVMDFCIGKPTQKCRDLKTYRLNFLLLDVKCQLVWGGGCLFFFHFIFSCGGL